MKTFDYKASDYFPSALNAAGVVIFIAGFFLVFLHFYLTAGIMMIGGIVVITTQYRFEIDPAGKVFREYVWILGMKNGAWTEFDTVEYLYIKKARVSETMSSRANTTTIHKMVYEGYMRFSEEIKVQMGTDENKQALMKRLAVMAGELGIEIVDHSGEGPTV